MSNNIFTSIDANTTTGTQLADILNDFKDAYVSGNSGTSRPAALEAGGCWIDITNNPSTWELKLYDGSIDITLFVIDLSSGVASVTSATDTFTISNNSDENVGAALKFLRSASEGIGQVQAGDKIAVQSFVSTDEEGNEIETAQIEVSALEDHTTTSQGTGVKIKTTKSGSSELVDRIDINSESVDIPDLEVGNVSKEEISYLDDVTSPIQAQLDALVSADIDLQDSLDAEVSARAAADLLKQDLSGKNSPNGYAGLDSAGKVPVSLLPNSIMQYQGLYDASTNTPELVDGIGNTGDVYKVAFSGAGVNSLNFVLGDYAVYNGTTWEKSHSGADAVQSVNGKTGAVVLTKEDIGLPEVKNVDTTIASNIVQDSTHRFVTDAEKLIWDAKQNALIAGTDYLAPNGNGSQLTNLTASNVTEDPNHRFATDTEKASWNTVTSKLDSSGGVVSGSLYTGTVPTNGQFLFVSRPLTGNVNSYHVHVNSLVSPDVTSSAMAFRSTMGTEAGSFNLPQLYHFLASNGAIGAGSTVTNQYGFQAAILTVATNNYGFYGQVPTATNNFNLFMAGATKNYFGGQIGIGTTTPTPNALLDVVSTTQASMPFPRMTAAQKNAIVSPATGMMVYDTDLAGLSIYNAGTWQPLISSAPQTVQVSASYLQHSNFYWTIGSAASSRVYTLVTPTTSNIGTDIQYIKDAVNGDRFVALADCICTFSASLAMDPTATFGLSKNSVNLTSTYSSLPASERLMSSNAASSGMVSNLTWSGKLLIGDVIRLHSNNGISTYNTTVGNQGYPVTSISSISMTCQPSTVKTSLITVDTAVASLDVDWSLGDIFYKSVSANSTFTFSNLANGRTITLIIKNTGTSNIDVVLPSALMSGGAGNLNLTIMPARENIYTFIRSNNKTYVAVIADMA